MILKEGFHYEIFKLLTETIKTNLSFKDLRNLPKQDFRAYVAARERRIKERRIWVDPEIFPALTEALSNWSENFASNSNMSRADKDMRQKEIQYLQNWIDTNKVP